MDFTTMETSAILERKAAIAAEMETDGADLNALLEEVRSANAELEARKAAEEAKAEIRKLADEKGKVEKEFTEEKKEVRKMVFDSVEYRNAWLKNLMGKEMDVEERAGYTQTGTNAIPTQVSNKFFEKMVKIAPMLSEITLLHAAGNIKFVVEGTRNTAAKHTELESISVSADSTVSVSLGAYEFYKILAISESARAMSIDAFEDWLVEMLAGDIARCIDNYILNDSTNGIAAVTYETGTNQIVNTATTGYTYDNLVDLIALIPAAYDAEAKILTSKKTLATVMKIVDSNKNPIFARALDGGPDTILGYPVVLDDYVTTANSAIYIGRWTDVVGNMSQDINVISYPDYDTASVKFRGGAFFDSKVAKTDAIARLVSTT